ncbi:Hypothetical predicted protein [Paramuricea clavata]|uniref:Uncharacterized protein n=1 Tax=Paramuricea clavata TaxID=317549 RepID=A0A6S7GY50_PARCT|nr:Hypothetical predicted protein [Paramuricea clavata]
MHEDGGKHFHMAVKLDKKKQDGSRQRGRRLCKNHPDLANATASRTTNATQKRKTNSKKRVASKNKMKLLGVYDVVRIFQSKGIKSRVELIALASKWQEQGKTVLAEFVCNRGPGVMNEAL